MPLPPIFRTLTPLVTGLAVGVMGTALFRDSLPGAEGSAELRATRLEVELRRAKNQLAALEADGRRRPGTTMSDGLRDIVADLRAGRPVTPDDLLRLTKPLMRDLEPLLERIRLRTQKDRIDGMTGELVRKYDLTGPQQEALRQWFERKAEADAKAWIDLVAGEGTTLEDMIRASHDFRPDEGLDAFMETQLGGEKLARFNSERMAERAERIQHEADRRVQRLDGLVGLDDAQRDQVFGIMARSSRDYDPAIQLEGIGGPIGPTPGGDRQDAILSVLRPEQRQAYEAERQRRRDEAARDLEAIGLTLPSTWDLFDDEDFR